MDSQTVVYSGKLAGEDVTITLEDVQQNDTVHFRAVAAGVKRCIDIAAQSHESEEDKARAKLARAHDFLSGTPWATGGGNRLTDAERARRDILATLAAQHLGLTHSRAEELARKDDAKAVKQTASAIIKRKDGKAPSGDRLAAGIDKLEAFIQQQVDARLSSMDVSI